MDYIEYDEAYADSRYEADEQLAKQRRKSRPKDRSDDLIPGVVVRALGHHYEVETNPADDEEGEDVRLCEVRGRLMQERTVGTLVAVGDRVWIVPEGNNRGKIEEIEDRTSVISRQKPGASMSSEDVILANPDQVLVVFAVAEPAPHLRMLDRFLVVAEFNELPATICVNKTDLVTPEQATELFGLYEDIGYDVIYASAETGRGVGELRELIVGQITVLTGPSGVGKSSLINALDPDLGLDVGDLREFLNKGRHTTRTARLLQLPLGEPEDDPTYVADTPGIRELGLYEIDPADLGFYFIEMEPFIHDCRYPNCTHDHEPGCAVRAAVEQGEIAQTRYESYLKLLHGEE